MSNPLMTITVNKSKCNLYNFTPFEEYSPWLDWVKWRRLPEEEKQEHYQKALIKYTQQQGKMIQAFVKGNRRNSNVHD